VRNYTDQAVLFSKETNGTDRVELDKNGFTFNNGTDFITWTFEGETIEFIPFESKGGIEILNESTVKLTKNALNNIAFDYKDEILPAKQYEAFVNDPLQVLKVSGSTNTTYHEVLKTAQKKRENHFKKHAIEDVFNTENKCEIVNINGIPDYTEDSILSLNIECQSKAGVQSLHIAINGVPVVGKNGTQYANQPNSINDSIALLLSTGVNKIEVFFYDREGLVVYAPIITIEAAYSSPEQMYFLGIGIDEYANPELNLKWCKKDILDLASALSKTYDGSFTLDTLFNQNVTLTNISAIRSRLERLGVNDKLIVSFSGHGVLDSTMNYYLSTHNIDFLTPKEQGLPYQKFEALLDGLAVRKRLVMIDACHSGIVDPSSFEVASSKSSDLALKGAISVQANSQKKVDETTSFELMQELFYITGNDIGATIVSAAAGNQYAYEKSGLENGVFTYSVLDVLRSNSQLFVNDLERLVGQKVVHLTKGLQKPTSRKVNTDFNWELWGN
jgi:hypothetical protein